MIRADALSKMADANFRRWTRVVARDAKLDIMDAWAPAVR